MLNLIWKCQGKHAFSWWKSSRSFSFNSYGIKNVWNVELHGKILFFSTAVVKIPFSLKWWGTFFSDRLVGTAVKMFCLSQAIGSDPPLGWQQWYRQITSHTLCSNWVWICLIWNHLLLCWLFHLAPKHSQFQAQKALTWKLGKLLETLCENDTTVSSFASWPVSWHWETLKLAPELA